jgi:hypothetical protein
MPDSTRVRSPVAPIPAGVDTIEHADQQVAGATVRTYQRTPTFLYLQ